MKEAETMENQKKLLFLGGTGAMYDAVERAKRMGIYTIVVDYYPNHLQSGLRTAHIWPARQILIGCWKLQGKMR